MHHKRPLVALALLLGGCSQDSAGPGGGGSPPPSPLNVSNPRVESAAALNSTGPSISAADVNVAYVSVDPQTYPGGERATITNVHLNTTVLTLMVDGGFDPVAISATSGDNVEIKIIAPGGSTIATLNNVVPAKKPPKIVRTIPGRGKTGVPLNTNIEVVFTEPVAPASLSTSSVQLLRAGSAVAGSVGVLQGVNAAIVFTPASPLQANTAYELVITPGVRDLDGDALDSATTVPFTTGTTNVGSLASLSMIPDILDMSVGDQVQLRVVAHDAAGAELTGLPVIWTISAFNDAPIATISSTGLVTAREMGTAYILAEVNGFFIAGSIDVGTGLRAVASVTLSVDSLTLTPTKTFDLAAIARDADGNILIRRIVQFTSSNSQVAGVIQASDGETAPPGITGPLAGVPPAYLYRATVSGVSNGVARIIATIGGKSDTAVVTVGSSFQLAAFALSVDTATIMLHATVTLWGAAVNAAGGRDSLAGASIQWETSDPAVATIDAEGRVTTNAAGAATITARWSGYTATARITVKQITIRTISAGQVHTCALTVDDETYCWGGNELGQLGVPGISGGFRQLAQRTFSAVPVRAATQLKFTSITAAGFHTCALTAGGTAYCWGYNGNGSLGSGSFVGGYRAVAVTGGLTFAEIKAGTTHTCARTAGGPTYCWGLNRSGEVGSSSVDSTVVPLLVTGGHSFASITVGGSHSCALTSEGAAFCWGENAAGQLGVGESVTNTATPQAVSGGLTFSSLSAGESHTCGVTRAGQIYCWGWNLESQLGSGVAGTPSKVPIAVASSQSFKSVAAGLAHTCALDSTGAAWCWGQNLNGQVGIGAPGSQLFATPQRVTGGLVFDRLTAGRSHTCAQSAEGWFCWGSNLNGVLGIGSTANSGTPMKVLGQQ